MPKYHICLSLFSCQQLAVIIPRHQRRGGEGRSRAGERHLPVPRKMPETKKPARGRGDPPGAALPHGGRSGGFGDLQGEARSSRPQKDALKGMKWDPCCSYSTSNPEMLPYTRLPERVSPWKVTQKLFRPRRAWLPLCGFYHQGLFIAVLCGCCPKKIQFPSSGNCWRHLKINRAARAGDRRSKSDVTAA